MRPFLFIMILFVARCDWVNIWNQREHLRLLVAGDTINEIWFTVTSRHLCWIKIKWQNELLIIAWRGLSTGEANGLENTSHTSNNTRFDYTRRRESSEYLMEELSRIHSMKASASFTFLLGVLPLTRLKRSFRQWSTKNSFDWSTSLESIISRYLID